MTISTGQIWEWTEYWPDYPLQLFSPGDRIIIKESPLRSQQYYVLVTTISGENHVVYGQDIIEQAKLVID